MNEFSWTNYNGISEIMLLEGTYTKDNLPIYEAYGATPSLEFPSEIEAVGDNKNLSKIDKISTINGGYINASCGVLGAIEAGETYTISFNCSTKHTGTNSIYLRVAVGSSYENQTNLNYSSGKRISKTFTAINSGELSFSASLGTDYTNALYDIKLEKGTIPTPYSPYGQGSANVTIQNENYYDKSKAYADGANKQNIMIDKIQGLEVGENYTAYANGKGWLQLKEYDKEGNVIATYGRDTYSSIFVNFTKSSNDSRISMQFYSNGNNVDVSTYDFTNVMVVKGTYTNASQLPAYVEHEEQTFTIPIQQEMLEGDCFDDTEYHVWEKIDSYNGEEITTEFKSTTGELSIGATVYYKLAIPKKLELTSEQKVVLDEIKKTAQSYKNITNIYSTDELSPVFEVEYRKKIESKTILSETVRKIVIVDDYPDVEEDGVLYLKKGTGSSSSGGGEMLTNLYYQDSDKEHTSSSSGYSCNWRTTKTVEINSDTYMIKDTQRSSNTFTLDLKENTTYKLVFNYVSGSGAKETETGKINYSLWNETTSTKLISQSTECGVSSEVTFTSTTTETITAEMQMYLYTGVHYQDLIYEIGLYEVS